MNRPSSFAALAIALLAHAGLIAIAIIGFPLRIDQSPEPVSIVVKLLPAQQETEAPSSVSTSAPPTPPAPPVSPPAPAPLPAPPEEKPIEQKPVRKVSPEPVAKPRPVRKPAIPKTKAPTPPAAATPVTTPVTPTAPDAASVPAASPPAAPEAPPVPAAPAPPAKTGVYISAEYAATNRKPVYPSMSMRYGEQGTVVLRVLVKADGTAGQVEIKTSSGYPLLDDSARTAVQGWRFHPATSDGQPIADWFLIPIPFKLQN